MKKIIEFAKTKVTVLGLGLFVLLTFLVLGNKIVNVFKYWSQIIGPTLYILFPMAGLLISIILLIITGKINERFPSVKELKLIEEGAPVIGLFGTILALVRGFGHLDLTKSLDTSITAVISIIDESLLSTAIGLMIGLLAWFIKKRFVPEHLVEHVEKNS